VAGADNTLSMSFVFGESALYVNGVLRAQTRGGRELTADLLPADLGRTTELLLISRGNAEGAVGMAALVPPYVSTDTRQVATIRRFLQSVLIEQRVFRIAVASILALLFTGLWLSGLRYWDIVWVAAMSASVALDNGLNYLNIFAQSRQLLYRTAGLANFALAFATLLLQYSVLRPERFGRKAGAVVGALAVAAAALVYGTDDATFLSWHLATRLQTYVLVAGLAAYLPIGWWTLRGKGLPEAAKKRIRRSLYTAAAAAALFGAQAAAEDKLALYLAPLAQIFLLLQYAATVLVDLSRRQLEYFRERELRIQNQEDAAVARAVARSAQMLAHDVRRPFALIGTYLKRLAGREDQDEARRAAMLADLAETTAEVDELLAELQSYDAVVLTRREPVPVGPLVRRIWAALAPETAAKGLRLAAADDLGAIDGDPVKVRRIFRNIIENAVQAANASGSVAVTQSGERWEIRNSGSFVPPELRQRVFDAAFTRGKKNGTGLGLAIVKKFVEAHGGTIACESDLAGTSFVLRMPGAKAGAPAAATAQRIVLIDDDELIRLGWTASLAGSDFRAYADPHQALTALTSPGAAAPDLVLVDRHFRGSAVDGIWLAAALRAAFPKARILLASSDAHLAPDELRHFDGVVGKEPVAAGQLLPRTRAQGERG
jgi:signal transduction histidine kinase